MHFMVLTKHLSPPPSLSFRSLFFFLTQQLFSFTFVVEGCFHFLIFLLLLLFLSFTVLCSSRPPFPPLNPRFPSTMRRALPQTLVPGRGGLFAALRHCSTTAAAEPAEVPPAAPAAAPRTLVRNMKPRELMKELDRYIVGQSDAKKAVAVALRNRWRRHQVAEDIREEIAPKNILMIGPTGVGKTEIARRLAKLVDAPFVKVEATKFTEVGFHGRDVDSIIEDLYKASLTQTKQNIRRQHEEEAKVKAEDRILKALAGESDGGFRNHLRTGALDDIEVMVELQEKKEKPKSAAGGEGVFIALDMQSMMGNQSARTVKKVMKIKDAFPAVLQEELDKMMDTEDVTAEALRACQEDGIVVIDEIDKIVTAAGGYKGHQASAEGVQQDLLPLVEGTTVSTKANVQVKTDKILFICSGAFHSVKPADMLAELQGRLPIRVELQPLSKEDFYRIITEPKYNLIMQHKAMLATEGVDLVFQDDALWEIASMAAHINSTVQNIGARRLITITEKVVEEISFDGPERKGEQFVIDAAYVKKAVEPMAKKVDIKKFLL
ncbi:ATP-dependent HslUV protease ATP-binding protein subunit HslU [Strigomonas culicis]|uniref:ATP-dependent HslUV protease ATP-binding protein subunit HslU n=2 Tax=Strigomonas culicis TaxID=28005 RepID=S9UAE1_9TRYP|nr:ATP-dependent HslUV protease ATP-binding protein subunit HslU [Strigomonas culicis]|eukprot:EPY27742.1 ATP-dependent HslUV protease ATP-binding protein subunit HslU [Strigomonas culicis]